MPFFGVPIRNGLPIGLGSVAGFGVQQFDPSQLFEGGTVAGAWYDPSDLSTMFDTSVGTTPVAMPGQGAAVPVGLMLDKSQNGVGTNGAKRVNLLTYSEEFDNAAWAKGNINTTGTPPWVNVVVAPDGTTTADKLIANTNNATHTITQVISSTFLVPHAFSIYAKAAEYSFLSFGQGSPGSRTFFDLSSGVVVGPATGSGLSSATITPVGNGWYRCAGIISSLPSGSSFAVVVSNSSASETFTGDGTSGIYIWGADLRLASEANTLPLYQPITSSWYSTLPGNHAVSIAPGSSTSRPELRARVNLLTYSEEFDNGAWTKSALNAFGSGSVANTTATLDPLGGNTADYIQEDTASSAHSAYWTLTSAVSSATYTYSIYVKSAGQNRWLRFNVGNNTNSWFNPDTGLWGTVAAGYTAGTPENVGNGWWRVSLTGVAGASTVYLTVGLATGNNNTTYLGIGSAGLYFWGADLRPANIGANIPAYQRIADANTYDTNGFPLYLRFDGIDDGMYTPANLNLSATDKVGVFAGVRKLSDATIGTITELSSNASTTNGTFQLRGPATNGAQNYYATVSGTSVAEYLPATFAAPISNVVSSIMDIAGASISTELIPRVNGIVEQDSPSGSAGTGNFGTYPLYIGSRNNSTFWLNGHLYSLAVVGSAVSAGNIAAMENWVAGKTGIQI